MGSGWRLILALGGLVFVSLRGAAAAESMTAVYAFSWAGVDVGTLEVLLEAEQGGYRASWEAGTAGLVGAMFPFRSQGSAIGRRDGDRFLPMSFDGRSSWRDGGSQWRVAFAADGRATQIEVPAEDRAGREPVPQALQIGPDPASLALSAIARAAPGARLDGQSFDGRRAVRLELACAEAQPSAELPCTISGHLLAGGSHDRPRHESERQPWRVWLREGVHGDGFWPVRLEAPSRFGTVGARLISIDRPSTAG